MVDSTGTYNMITGMRIAAFRRVHGTLWRNTDTGEYFEKKKGENPMPVSLESSLYAACADFENPDFEAPVAIRERFSI